MSSIRLQQIKLLFGKNCFCKDIAGFYPVEKGIFKIKPSKGRNMEIIIEFNVPKVGSRQIIGSVI